MADLEHRYANVGEVLNDAHRTSALKLHYVIAGEGDPVLLIHGFPQTWYEWRNIIDELAKHYTVIAPDYRGAGRLGPPAGRLRQAHDDGGSALTRSAARLHPPSGGGS